MPGWGAVEAVTSLHCAGLLRATQIISQDHCFIGLSGAYLGAEDVSGLQANPTGETAWTPLANFPPGKKSEKKEDALRTHAEYMFHDMKCSEVKTPNWECGKFQYKIG